MSDREYLGDGVFADVERGMVKLTTEDGIEATNTIYLEPEVMAALQRWYTATRKKYAPRAPLQSGNDEYT
jgi:hypothetical protein